MITGLAAAPQHLITYIRTLQGINPQTAQVGRGRCDGSHRSGGHGMPWLPLPMRSPSQGGTPSTKKPGNSNWKLPLHPPIGPMHRRRDLGPMQ